MAYDLEQGAARGTYEQRRAAGEMMVDTTSQPTLEALRRQRAEIIRVAAANGASNIRVFGSVARGESDGASDIDLLVDIIADAHGLAYFGILEDLRHAISELVGWDVHVVDSASLERMKLRVLREAVPL